MSWVSMGANNLGFNSVMHSVVGNVPADSEARERPIMFKKNSSKRAFFTTCKFYNIVFQNFEKLLYLGYLTRCYSPEEGVQTSTFFSLTL